MIRSLAPIASMATLALVLVSSSIMGAETGIKVGDAAPAVEGGTWVSKDGKAPDFEGKVHIVEFWFSACGPCNEAAPHLAALAKKYADKGLVVVSPSLDGEAKVRDFKKRHNVGDEISYLADGRGVARAYGVSRFPTAFIVDKSGTVGYAGHPMNDDFEIAVARALK